MKVSIKIHMREEDKSDALLERIADAVAEWVSKEDEEQDYPELVLETNNSARLLYTLSVPEDLDKASLVESFKNTMWRFFDVCQTLSYISVLHIGDKCDLDDIKHHFKNDEDVRAYLADEDGGVDIDPSAGLPVVPLAKNSKTPLPN